MDSIRYFTSKRVESKNCSKSFELDENRLAPYALSEALSEMPHRVLKTNRGVPVVPAMFNPYRLALSAPDHPLHGLLEDLLNVGLMVLTFCQRLNVEALIKGSHQKNRMLTAKKILQVQLSPSALYGRGFNFKIVQVSLWDFRDAPATDTRRRIHLKQAITILFLDWIASVQELFASTWFFYHVRVGGKRLMLVHRHDCRIRLCEKSQKLSSSCDLDLHHVCINSNPAKEVLDKSSVHTLLGFYSHTIQACFVSYKSRSCLF